MHLGEDKWAEVQSALQITDAEPVTVENQLHMGHFV